MKVLSNEFKSYNINSMSIVAKSMKEALEYVWFINNPIRVVCDFGEGRKMEMQLQVAYQSCFLEDSLSIAMEERLEMIGLSYDTFDVYTVDGQWLTSSEL